MNSSEPVFRNKIEGTESLFFLGYHDGSCEIENEATGQRVCINAVDIAGVASYLGTITLLTALRMKDIEDQRRFN